MATRAWLRVVDVANQPAETRVEVADRETSKADARAALCLANGVPPDDIDPATGLNVSRDAYQQARGSWVRFLSGHRLSDYVVRDCREAGRRWRELRPEWVAELPWPRPAACDTCDTPGAEWDATDPLHLPGTSQCPWCRRVDIEDDKRAKRRDDV